MVLESKFIVNLLDIQQFSVEHGGQVVSVCDSRWKGQGIRTSLRLVVSLKQETLTPTLYWSTARMFWIPLDMAVKFLTIMTNRTKIDEIKIKILHFIHS